MNSNFHWTAEKKTDEMDYKGMINEQKEKFYKKKIRFKKINLIFEKKISKLSPPRKKFWAKVWR